MHFRQEKAPRQGRDCPGPRALVDEAKDFASGEDTGQALEQPCEFIIATHARLAIAKCSVVHEGVEPSTAKPFQSTVVHRLLSIGTADCRETTLFGAGSR